MKISSDSNNWAFIKNVEPSWKCELHKDTYWHVVEGKQPNRFHRFMQRLCFGFKWTKL